MKRVYLTLTCLAAPVAIAACATKQSSPPAPAPMPVALAPASAAPAGPTTAPVLASSEAAPASAAPAKPMSGQDLPAGHPDINQLMAERRQKAKMNGELPAGHPPISGAKPPGAPLAGNAAKAWAQGSATTRPAPALFGSLVVKLTQGTAGGPAIGELSAIIELEQGEKIIDKTEVKTATDGTLRLDSIPLDLMATPVVKVTYKDVEYTATGVMMAGANSEQQLQLAVYETTEDAPAWNVQMQHVMLEPTVEGVRVSDMLSIENPTDRAWVGKVANPADKAAKRRTLAFALPQGAKDVQFGGGLHDCCTTIEEGKVFDSMALIPGVSQYRISYTLPVSAGKAELAFATPASVKHLMVFVPDDGSTVTAQGLGDPSVSNMGGGATRFYRATNLAAGAAVKLSLSNITARPAQTPAGTPLTGRGAGSAQMAKIIAGVGGLGIFVVGGMVLMFKAPKAKKA